MEQDKNLTAEIQQEETLVELSLRLLSMNLRRRPMRSGSKK